MLLCSALVEEEEEVVEEQTLEERKTELEVGTSFQIDNNKNYIANKHET